MKSTDMSAVIPLGPSPAVAGVIGMFGDPGSDSTIRLAERRASAMARLSRRAGAG